MNVLWKLKKAFVKDVIEHWPDDQAPAYNTVSTILRMLEDENKEKTYVTHESFGRSHRYMPLISKAQYQKKLLNNVVENVFSGSRMGLLSSLLDDESLSEKERQELQNLIDNFAE